MSSLQALLDAQEQRRGGGSGGGGGNGRVGRGHSSHNYQSRPFSSSSQSWPSSSHSTSSSSTNNRNVSGQQWQHDQVEGLRGGTYNNDSGGDHSRNRRWHCDQPQQQQQQQPSSTRWQREEEAVERRGSSRRGHGHATNFSSTAADTPTTNNEGGEATYEQRRANIKQRAIDDSHAAMKSNGRSLHRGIGRDDNEQKDTNNSQHDNGDDDFKEEDIKSLSSWVGPLVAIFNEEYDHQYDKMMKHTKMICTYYQDREKRYPFYTDERGYQLLHRLLEANYELLRMNHRLIGECAVAFRLENPNIASKDKVLEGGESSCDNYVDAKDVIIRIGRGLYAHKPTLRTKGVTWSTEEYSHPGLARMYLRMKSIQRFTEIWCLLERSAALGVFDEIFDHKGMIASVGEDDDGGEGGRPVVRIAAVGGGPGYELLATKLFFEERMPNSGMQLELTCMDICPAWRHYAEALGFTFVEYDINNEDGINPLQAMGLARGELHFCIVSCVMIYVTNDRVMNMFHNLVHNDGVKAILVSERGERTLACTMMEELGGKVIRLIDQSDGMDERQAIWCSQEFAEEKMRTCHPDYEAHQSESVFPNVPYCEHKERRRRRPQSGRYRKCNNAHFIQAKFN
ncbi:hypothetical protein ACHAXH_002169 [Discostella pseudostelligera]